MNPLYYFGIFAPLLPILFFLLFKRKSQERAVWVIFFYILYCAINELINFYLQHIKAPSALFLFAFFTIAEFSFISYYYLQLFKEKIKVKKVIKILWISFIVYTIINILHSNGIAYWDSIAIGIESLIILILTSYYLFIKIKRTNSLSFYTNFNFWISVTFLIYFSGTFFLNILADAMYENPEYQILYFYINIGFNILKSILLAVAMTMKTNNNIRPAPQPDLDMDFHLKNHL